MHNSLRMVITIAVTALFLVLIRCFVITIFVVDKPLADPSLAAGERLIVWRLWREPLAAGDRVVAGDSLKRVFRIDHTPGDTVVIGTSRFVIPTSCCSGCLCNSCGLYLVSRDGKQQLIRRHDIVGKARHLFTLRKWI